MERSVSSQGMETSSFGGWNGGIDALLGVGISMVLYMIYPQKDFEDFYCRRFGHRISVEATGIIIFDKRNDFSLFKVY